jgi:hypothetical protein
MWFAIILLLAVALSVVSPKLATASAWMLTLGVNVPIMMVSAGTIAWGFGLMAGAAAPTLASWFTWCVFFGGPPAALLTWWTFKD